MIICEGLEQDYYIKKTNDAEVQELLLRGHYLGDWPFVGSHYKDYIYGVYLKRSSKQLPLVPLLNKDEELNDDVLIGCIVYGFPEYHASSYVSKWIRGLLNPDESIETIYKNIGDIVKKDKEEELKAKERGYPFHPKAKILVQNILKASNIQDKQILELKRLYMLPKFDLKNIESFAISRGNKVIFNDNPNIQVIVSYSDSKVGHYGGVYQATNALYAGINKSGLHRYLYPRDSLTAILKKYQPKYDELVFKYPKAKESDKKYGDKSSVKLTKRERLVVNYLKELLPKIHDESLKSAVTKVLDVIEGEPQRTFPFTEVKQMIVKELLVELTLKKLKNLI